jgi:hypothetical protein
LACEVDPALNFEPERRSVTLYVSSRRRGIVGADNQNRLVGPLGEHLRAGDRRDLGVAVEARRPVGVCHLARMVGYVAGDCRVLPLRFDHHADMARRVPRGGIALKSCMLMTRALCWRRFCLE